jgi:hypothetical protein
MEEIKTFAETKTQQSYKRMKDRIYLQKAERACHHGPDACSHQLTLQLAAAIPQYETQQQTNQPLFPLCLHLKHQQKNPSFVEISSEECHETHPCSKHDS